MGQTLSEPVTAKETASCSNSFVKVGSSSMQGWRINMEDAHTTILSVPEDNEASFFAVYDGHGGAKIAHHAGGHLHKRIVQSREFSLGQIENAIKNGFLEFDSEMIQDDDFKDELAGTTAVCVILKNQRIYCGNVGDSRAVASVGGLAQSLSYDHKPANENEAKRIIAAGGWVEFNRVNGNLALSRALGDFIFKKNEEKPPEEQIVSACPDVLVREITPEHEFILLACDGIWDVLSNQEVVDFCRDRLASKMEPEIVCEELLTRCLAPDCQMGGLGCDNMTVVLVCLTRERSWEEYCGTCSRPRPPTPLEDDGAGEVPMMPSTDGTPVPTPSPPPPPVFPTSGNEGTGPVTGDSPLSSPTGAKITKLEGLSGNQITASTIEALQEHLNGGDSTPEYPRGDNSSDDEAPPQSFEAGPPAAAASSTLIRSETL